MTAQPLPTPPIPETLYRLKGPPDKDEWYQVRWKPGKYVGVALMKRPDKVGALPVPVCAAVQPTDALEPDKVAAVVRDLRTLVDEQVARVAVLVTLVDVEVTLEEIGEES